LAAENALRCGEAVVHAVERREAEAPVEVIGLDGVRNALDVDGRLIELNGIRVNIVSGRGVGEAAFVRVERYPRWSASVWDLVARVICLSLHGKEELAPFEAKRTGAFIHEVTAVVQRWPDGFATGRSTIGTAVITMRHSRRYYEAAFEDDMTGCHTSKIFYHAPKELVHWDLLARAYAHAFTGREAMPARPALCTPIPVETDEGSMIPVDLLKEPARTGLYRWMTRRRITPTPVNVIKGDCVTEAQFSEFLARAL